MNNLKIVISIFFATIVIACKSTDKVSHNANFPEKKYTFPCKLCDYWINVEKAHLPKEKYLGYTLPNVVEIVTPNDVIVEHYDSGSEFEAVLPEGPRKIYTQLEWNRAKAMRFCFIGKTKTDIRDIFDSGDSVNQISTRNGLHFNSLVEHRETESSSYEIASPLQICSSMSQGRYLQFINFSSDSIFLGNQKDSTFLYQCRNRVK